MAVVERFKQESMYGLPPNKSGRYREVAVSGCSTVVSFCGYVIPREARRGTPSEVSL